MLPVAPCLADLCRHVQAVRTRTSAEDVHQLRTHAARLGVWVRLSGKRVLRADLRWLRRSCARLRDFDVVLERPLPAKWREWLVREREREAVRVREQLASPRLEGLVCALELAREPDVRCARKELTRLGRALARDMRALRKRDGSLDELHALRRRARRLRYAREWHGRTTQTLVRLQRELGPLGDATAELRLLHEAPRDAELALHAKEVARALELQRANAARACTPARRRR